MRGGTFPGSIIVSNRLFQSTLPMRGGTHGLTYTAAKHKISIHPPHAGRDISTHMSRREQTNFNPPSPCGEGPILKAGYSGTVQFQSTLPMRGGTEILRYYDAYSIISIHPPHAGRDSFSIVSSGRRNISIHPPHAGRDAGINVYLMGDNVFQSTLPMRGGTAQVHKIYLETYAHITKQAINRGTYSEAFKVFPHIMAYFAVFFYANLPGNLCLLPLRIIK